MIHTVGLHALPVELLSIVFDALSVEEIVGASHVSPFWRTVALRHPTYWRKITLKSLSTTALDFFHARLDAGLTRTVLVTVSLPQVEFPVRLCSVVLPAVARNLYRIDRLYLRIDLSFDSDIMEALKHPAPRMDELDLVLTHNTQGPPTSDALPADLFACQAPNLRFLRLVRVQLFADRLPLAFSGVEDFEYCFGEAQSFPTAVFAHCPSLKKLTIYGKYCSLDTNDELSRALDISQLKSIDVSVFSGSFDIMQHIPCASIPDITVSVSDHESVQFLLAHLRGRLEVHLDQTENNVYVRYKSRETGMQRSFACVLAQPSRGSLPPVYVADDLLSRIDAVYTTGTCTGLLTAFRELPSCTRLVVSLGERESCHLPTGPLSAPALECIELASPDAAALYAEDLALFLDHALLPVARPLRVALAGLTVDGDLAALGDRFVISPTRKS